jgi:hypothetical protein
MKNALERLFLKKKEKEEMGLNCYEPQNVHSLF